MSSVERYAIRFLESSGAYITLEQIKAAKVGNQNSCHNEAVLFEKSQGFQKTTIYEILGCLVL